MQPALAQVIERALAADPTDRYASAREFLEALRGAAAGAAVPAGPRASPGSRRGARWLIGAAAVAVLAALAFDGGGRRPFDPRRVAIAGMSNETGDSALSYLEVLTTARLTAALAGPRGLRVVTSAIMVPPRLSPGLEVDSLDDRARLRIA
jgi:hypothetical protein